MLRSNVAKRHKRQPVSLPGALNKSKKKATCTRRQKNTKKQQERNIAKCQQAETKDQDPVINNLASVSTTAIPCKKSLEFLNIQAEEDESCSDSSSKENKTMSDSFKSLKCNKEDNMQALPGISLIT